MSVAPSRLEFGSLRALSARRLRGTARVSEGALPVIAAWLAARLVTPSAAP
jgi:hypothetical protein